MADESGWSEKGKKSGKGKRPPRPDADSTSNLGDKAADAADAADAVADTAKAAGNTAKAAGNTAKAAGNTAKDVAESTAASAKDTAASAKDTAAAASTVVRRPSGDGARKVAKAAATAGQRDVSFASRLGFPALVALICLLGIGAVTYAYTTREALATPRANIDHWHAVYGVYDCTQPGEDKYLPAFLSSQDETGIHSHGDGIMHVHPFFELSSGNNALMRHWLSEMQLTMTDDTLVLDTGRELVEGTQCADGSGVAELRILHWDFDFEATEGLDPDEVHLADFGDIKFDNDREVYVIAFAAAGTDVGLPPADRFNTLNNVSSEIAYNPTELEVQSVTVDGDSAEDDEG